MDNTWYDKLLDTAKDIAPVLAGGAATIASGGNPALGALVSSVISKVVGRPGVDLEEAAESILGDPKAIAKFRLEMKEAEMRELEIRAKDTQSARELIKNSAGPVIISSLVTVAFSVLVFMVMFVDIPDASQAVSYLLLGTLATAFTQVLNFWLGTSLGSKEKDTTISRFASAAERDQQARRQDASR